MRKILSHRNVKHRNLVIGGDVMANQPAFSWLKIAGNTLFAVIGMLAVSVHAAAPLTDDELDTKFLDVPVKSPYISKVEFDKANTHQSVEAKPSKMAFNGSTALVLTTASDTPLLAGIDQNTRLLGNADQLGVSTGISSSAIPLAFGSENYSYKWSGNLDQVFTPSVEASRLLQYVYNTNGAEVYYVPLYRTGSTESFVHTDVVVRN